MATTIPPSQIDRNPGEVNPALDPGIYVPPPAPTRPSAFGPGNVLPEQIPTATTDALVTASGTNITPNQPVYISVSENGNLILERATSLNFTGVVNVTADGPTATINVSSTGNWGFFDDTIYNFAGGQITNGDPSHGATSFISVPANGNGNPVSILNYYGNIVLTPSLNTGATYPWVFDRTGNLVMPSNNASINYANGQPYGGGGGGGGNTFASITMTNGPAGASDQIKAGLGNLVVWNDGGWVISEWNGTNYGTEGMRINPGVEGSADISLPSDSNAATVPVQVSNYGGNVAIMAGTGSAYPTWTFNNTGVLALAPGEGVVRAGNTNSSVNIVSSGYAQLEWVDTGNLTIANPNDSDGPKNWAYVDQNGFAIETNINNANAEPGRYWNFDNNGYLNFPGTGTIGNFANTSLDPATPTASTMTLTPDANYAYQAVVLDPTAPGHIHLRAPAIGMGNIDQPAANLFIGGELSSFEIGTSYGEAPNVFVHSNGNTWTFAGDGNVITPSNLVIGPLGSGPGSSILQYDAPVQLISEAANGFAAMGWAETTTGPGNVAVIGFNSPLPSGVGNVVIATGNNGATQYNWVFDNQGKTLLPLLSTTRGDTTGGSVYGYTLRIGDGQQEAVFTTPDGGTNGTSQSSQRLVINPGAGQEGTSGEGGDIYLWAGRGGSGDIANAVSGGSGGDIKIRGGQGIAGGDGGYIRIDAGDSNNDTGAAGYIQMYAGTTTGGTPGYVDIRGGYNGSGVGGNITLLGGQGTTSGGNVTITGGVSQAGLASYGNVSLVAGASTWAFDNTGTLTLPYSATVKTTSDYAIAIGVNAGTGGSSAVSLGSSAGANAQSFDAIAIGGQAGANTQGGGAIAIGGSAGADTQGSGAIAIGPNAGQFSQGISAIAIGGSAGYNVQANNSIVINASGNQLDNATANSLVIAPVRNDTANIGEVVFYNTASKEITYGNAISVAGTVAAAVTITTPVAFANLTAVAGARAFVSDGNLVAAGGGSFGAQISGGGSNICPVWSDGTNWYVG